MLRVHLKNKYLVYIAMIIPFFCGYGGVIPNIITLVELLISFYLIDSDDFFLLIPIMCIYYSQLLLFGANLSGYNLLMWLCVLKMFLEKKVIKEDLNFLIGILILMFFSSVVMMVWQGMWNGINFLIMSIGTVYAALKIRQNDLLKMRFKTVLVGMCISATIYGVVFVNIKGIYEQTNGLINYTGRYCGTMADPNYMAFFYCICVAYIAFAENITLLKKGIMISVMFISTALTGSLTALFTIFIILFLYIWLGEKNDKKRKILSSCIVIVAAIILYYLLFTNILNIKIFTVFRNRLDEKLLFFGSKNYSAATSGRTKYSNAYIEYLFSQNILRILFGGYQLNAMGLIGNAYESIRFAAHNSYVDVLMTCGTIGFLIFIWHFLSNIFNYYKKWKKGNNSQRLSDAVVLLISAFFLSGLSCFPSTVYMLFIML